MTFEAAGFEVFPPEPAVLEWVQAASPVADAAVLDSAARRAWLRHCDTWFVGVDVLPNDTDGAVTGGPPFQGAARRLAEEITGPLPLHRAQVSVTYPGYPGKDPDESDAAHRYRLARDAAHVDGLLPVGPERRRYLKEPHAWILGVALNKADPAAAPLVVWPGSHLIMGAALAAALSGHSPQVWSEIDLTDAYQAARREVFDRCRRVEVPLVRGETVLVHRHMVHGVAPWGSGVSTPDACRSVAYFRPCFSEIARWI